MTIGVVFGASFALISVTFSAWMISSMAYEHQDRKRRREAEQRIEEEGRHPYRTGNAGRTEHRRIARVRPAYGYSRHAEGDC